MIHNVMLYTMSYAQTSLQNLYYAVIVSQVVVFEKTCHCGSYEAITLRSVSPIKYSPTLLVVYHR